MSDVPKPLNAADFSDRSVVDLAQFKCSPQLIASTAVELSEGAVGHVLVHEREDGTVTWTPTWRPFGENDPGLPQGFPDVQTGYGRDMAEVITKFRYFHSLTWRDVPPTKSGQALVFDRREDADAFVRLLESAA